MSRAMPLYPIEKLDAERNPVAGQDHPDRAEVLRQLERIVGSQPFRNSKRYPAFLRFIVEHTLSGHTELLKERTLGMEVFQRRSDYDTNADPVVRVTAGEIRKRLAQFYQSPGHEHELRIDLPVGSYVPHFTRAAQEQPRPEVTPVDPAPPSPAIVGPPVREAAAEPAAMPEVLPAVIAPFHRPKKPRWIWAAVAVLAVLVLSLAGVHVARAHTGDGGTALFWSPILEADTPTLIVIGVHTLGSDGRDLSPVDHAAAPTGPQSMLSSMTSYDMVPVSDIIAYSHLTNLLAASGHAFRTQSAAETTFSQLQQGQVILIGGLDNTWTMRLTSHLRFRFEAPSETVGTIADSQRPGTAWNFDNAQRLLSNSRDYAIVAGYFDPQIERHVLIAAGIGKDGTAAATEFLTDKQALRQWLSQAGLQKHENVELVLSTEIVEGQKGPAHVIAATSW